MSNVLKSKSFFGVMIVGVIVALALVAIPALAYTHTVTLKMGSTGSQVMSLQQALNGAGFLVSATGAGSPGMESTFFGAKTKSAVMSFQMAHGLTADGVVGPMTGAALGGSVSGNFPAGCTSASGFSTTTGMPCNSSASSGLPAGCSSTAGYSMTTGHKCDGSDTGSSTGGTLSGGETDVNGVSVDDADDTNINEGASKVPVADISFDVDDADAKLVRADIVFQLADGNTGEDKPWRAFDEVFLMDGSKVLASVDASDSDNWDDATQFNGETENDANSIRFNNIDAIYQEGSKNNDLWVAVDVGSSVDGSDSGEANWFVGVDTDGLRFTDGAGIDTFVDAGTMGSSGTDKASISIEQSGAQSDLTITKDSSSPSAGTLQVDSTSSTTEDIAVFKIKADADGGDVKLNDFPVTLTIAGTGSEHTVDVIDDVMLVIDGTTYTTDTDGETDGITTYLFGDIEDDDVVIDAGDSLKVTVRVKFKSQTSGVYANGVTIFATSAVDDSDFEDADTGDDIKTQTLATPSAETQQLYAEGLQVSNFKVIGGNPATSTDDNGDNTKLSWKVSFDVTAFGDTFYVPKAVIQGTTASASGLAYTVYDETAGAVTTAGTESASTLSSGADDTDFTGYYTVNEGETETFTATITVQKGSITAGHFIHVQLEEVGYDTNGSGAVTEYDLAPAQDYDTLSDSIDA